MASAVRGFVLRAFVEKLAFLQKARRKGGGGEDFSRGDGLQTRQPRRFCPVVDERRNEVVAGSPGVGVGRKRNEKVSRGRGGKSSNVNTEHVAMRRKHPAQPAFLQRVP